jgi:hypothetical protein
MTNKGLKVEPRTTQPDQPCTPYRAKPKVDIHQPVENLRGVESAPTSRYPQRKTLPPDIQK